MAFIGVKEVLSLQSLGISTPLGPNNCCLSSYNWISVNESSNSAVSVVNVIRKEISKRNVKAESAVISPPGHFLAVRSGQTLQIYDLVNSLQFKSIELTGKNVTFWKWINDDILAIITDTDVIHWSMLGSGDPVSVMSRHSMVNGVPINYRVNHNLQWLMLVTATSFESHIVGTIQLHSIEKSCSQIIQGHAACFTQLKLLKNECASELFAFVNFALTKSEICIAQIGNSNEGDKPYTRKNCPLQVPAGTSDNFPASIEAVNSLSLLLVVWKNAFLAIHDMESGACLYAVPIVSSPVFATTSGVDNGILMISKSGAVLSANICVDKFLCHLETFNLIEVAAKIVWRLEMDAGSTYILKWFETLLRENKHEEAVWVAASAPKGILRNRETYEKLKMFSGVSPSPLISYFKLLIEKHKLLPWESVELCRHVVQQGKLEVVEKLLSEEKLECSENLGDLLFSCSKKLALSVYIRANVPPKAITCFAEEEKFQLLFSYSEKVKYNPDLTSITLGFLKSSQPLKAFNFAVWLAKENKLNEGACNIIDLFIERGLTQESIQILEILMEKNTREVGTLQTKLLILYLQNNLRKADEILEKSSFEFINRVQVAEMCEKLGLRHYAIFLYDDLYDWQRLLTDASLINFNKLEAFFATIDATFIMPCLSSILIKPENTDIAIQVATLCSTRVPTSSLIKIFESLKDPSVLFKFISKLIYIDNNEDVHQQYIETAVQVGKICELIQFCKTSTSINPVKAKNFLMNKKLKNAIPLMIICDRFDFIEEMTAFLINSDMGQFIKYFLEQINRSRLLIILERALSLGANDSLIVEIMTHSNDDNLGDALLTVEKRGRLSVLLQWLENLQKRGSKNKAIHTALVKLTISNENQPEKFLLENELYDTLEVGKFCSTFNPELTIVAFRKGGHDKELIEFCKKEGLVKQMTRYLLHRMNMELWLEVLSSNEVKNDSIVDCVTHLVSTESFSAESVSVSVKALMAADLPTQLLKLLETLVFDCPEFDDNRNLQNLYILTAIKADKSQVKELILRLKNIDVAQVAELARANQLYEEAVLLFQRCENFNLAMDVILNDLKDFKQAEEFALNFNRPLVWIKLGEALLNANNAESAIDALIRGGDYEHFDQIVKVATCNELWDKLINYLEIANANTKEQAIEAELIYVYARTNRILELKKLATQPILADIREIAERCFADELLEAAGILFEIVGCYSRLAETYALMGNLKESLYSAQRAENLQSWKALCHASLLKGEVEIACEAAEHLLTDPVLIEELVMKFEENGVISEMISTFEKIIATGKMGNAIITNFVILLIRHKPERCQHFLEEMCGSLHVPRVLQALEENHMWYELAFLLERHGDSYEAVKVMLDHPTEAWVHLRFKELLTKIGSNRAIETIMLFYLEYKPRMLNDVLIHLGQKLDATKVISIASANGQLPLIRSYLESRAHEDNQAINSACCQLYIDEDDWLGLRSFLQVKNNIDAVSLARQFENHESVGFRIISVDLYNRSCKWSEAMRVCCRDHLYQEAALVAELSGDKVLVQDLLRYFLQENKTGNFSALLFKCYHLIDPDLVLELIWHFDAWQYALPYFIQTIHNFTLLIADMKNKIEGKNEVVEESVPPMLMWNHN